MTAYTVQYCKLKQNANEGCNSCANLAGLVLSFIVCFIARFILLVIATLLKHVNLFHYMHIPFHAILLILSNPQYVTSVMLCGCI